MTNEEREWLQKLYAGSSYATTAKAGYDWDNKKPFERQILSDDGKGECSGCGFRRKLWPRRAGGRCKKCRKTLANKNQEAV